MSPLYSMTAVMQHAAMLIIVQQSTQQKYEVIYGDKGEAEETFLWPLYQRGHLLLLTCVFLAVDAAWDQYRGTMLDFCNGKSENKIFHFQKVAQLTS